MIPKDRTPDYYMIVPANEAEDLPEKRYAGYIVFVDADGKPVDVGSGSAPAVGTAAQLQAGTDTVTRTWTAKMIHDEIARQIAAIP